MPLRTIDAAAEEFIGWYSRNQNAQQEIALALERYLTRVLADANLRAMMVAGRAKSVDSIRGKLLRKGYKRPRSQVTDRIGARVIVYHSHEVDRVAATLRDAIVVRERDSSDKRSALGLREFGYRSYHLVALFPRAATALPSFRPLRGQVVEIQIRSLLEHVWAEIEHDVVYKSGADWPRELRRRFASLAGVLELLEHEFHQLTDAAAALVDAASRTLRAKLEPRANLDVPYMLGLLEIAHPTGLSFRRARVAGEPFPPGIEQRLNWALRRSGIETVGAMLRALRAPRLRQSVRRYAQAERIPTSEASHLAVLALIIGLRSPRTLSVFFPEFDGDGSIRHALEHPR